MKRYGVENNQNVRKMEESVPTRVARFSFLFAILLLISTPAFPQDWFRISTGLGVEKPRVAVADFAPRSDTSKAHSSLFTQVVRDDLGFSGILETDYEGEPREGHGRCMEPASFPGLAEMPPPGRTGAA